MVKRGLVSLGLSLLLTLGVAAQEAAPPVIATGVWARPGLAEGVSAVYLTLENTGETPLILAAADAPIAAEVQIHMTRMQDGVMQMREVEGVEVLPGEPAVLEPGGYHIMLLDLQQDLEPGDALVVDLTLTAGDDAEPLMLQLGAPVLEEAPPATDWVVVDAWVRPTAQVVDDELVMTSDVTAVYLQLLNQGETEDTLVGAATDVAGMVQVHETRMQNGVMQMREIEGGILLPVGEWAILEPGGQHIMLMNVQAGLVVGDAILVTLQFESGAELVIAVPVREPMMMEHE
jgi:periplasmic copper chaperone A